MLVPGLGGTQWISPFVFPFQRHPLAPLNLQLERGLSSVPGPVPCAPSHSEAPWGSGALAPCTLHQVVTALLIHHPGRPVSGVHVVLQGLPRVDRLATGGAAVGEGVGEVAALYVVSHVVGHLVGELGAKGAEESLGAALVLPNILDQVLGTTRPCGTTALVRDCGFIFMLNGLAQHRTRSVGGPVGAGLVDLQSSPGAAQLGTHGTGVLEGGRVVPRLAVVAHILAALVGELEAEAAGPAAGLPLLPHAEGEEVLRRGDRRAACGGSASITLYSCAPDSCGSTGHS